MRLPDLTPEQMTPDQRAVADRAVAGKRGRLPAPLRAWLHSPVFGDRAQSLGEFLRYDTSLGPMLSELAILVTARFWTAQYEWYAHKKLALQAGVSPAVCDAIARRERPPLPDAKAQTVYEYATTMHAERTVPPALHDRAVALLGEAGVVELVGILGYYTLVIHDVERVRHRRSRRRAGGVASMSGRLAGKVALITGAGCVGPGWGNGRSAAVLFAREGAQVLAVDLEPEPMAETVTRATAEAAHGGCIRTHLADVTDAAQVAAMVEACVAAYGRVDILVNNVGGSAKGGAVALSEDAWDRQIDFNLKSVFLTCKHVIPHMEAAGGGAIVNTASTSGTRWTGSAQVGYAASKAGVIQFGRVTAVEYAPKRIRVNTVVPGQMHTPMVEARLAGQRAGGDVDALLRSRIARIPLGFMGDGRDTANAALFLASDEARFITGTEIVVDGGMTARCD